MVGSIKMEQFNSLRITVTCGKLVEILVKNPSEHQQSIANISHESIDLKGTLHAAFTEKITSSGRFGNAMFPPWEKYLSSLVSKDHNQTASTSGTVKKNNSRLHFLRILSKRQFKQQAAAGLSLTLKSFRLSSQCGMLAVIKANKNTNKNYWLHPTFPR
ncbi:hypothetical protein ILYODFUR_037492 [Ilyodon furcidens]|uniref:Uncharacterized protein n=1 Tax=Ilyodon furcidens TaxID=33524 RepID=A0ABV0U0Y7_9TELE